MVQNLKSDWYKSANPNLERLAQLLGMGGNKPSHGYTIAEKAPEIVTAPGVYFPAEKGQVIPLESRQKGGPVSPSVPRDNKSDALDTLKSIVAMVKPAGLETKSMFGLVVPPEPMGIEKSKYDILKKAMDGVVSLLKPPPQGGTGASGGEKKPSNGGSKPSSPKQSTQPSPAPKEPSLPSPPVSMQNLPTSESFGMKPDMVRNADDNSMLDGGQSDWSAPILSRERGGDTDPTKILEEDIPPPPFYNNPSYQLTQEGEAQKAGIRPLTETMTPVAQPPAQNQPVSTPPPAPQEAMPQVIKGGGQDILPQVIKGEGSSPQNVSVIPTSYSYETPFQYGTMDRRTRGLDTMWYSPISPFRQERIPKYGTERSEVRMEAIGGKAPASPPGLHFVQDATGKFIGIDREGKVVDTGVIGKTPESAGSPIGKLISERNALAADDPLRSTYDAAIKKASEGEPKTLPSAGNAVDLAIKRKFGTDYLQNPEKSKEADKWLNTPEGRKSVQQARDDLTPPAVAFVNTSEGIAPGITRGTGAGTIGKPTGYKKPLTDAQLSKVGEINTILKNIDKTKELYGYGTKNEQVGWVGPVKGIIGGIEGKYLGTASSDQVKFYSYVKDMEDALLRARSGAQINEQEYARLREFLPEPNLPPVTFKARLERFQEATQTIMDEKLKAYEQGGLGVSGLKKGSPSPATEKPITTKSGKPYIIQEVP